MWTDESWPMEQGLRESGGFEQNEKELPSKDRAFIDSISGLSLSNDLNSDYTNFIIAALYDAQIEILLQDSNDVSSFKRYPIYSTERLNHFKSNFANLIFPNSPRQFYETSRWISERPENEDRNSNLQFNCSWARKSFSLSRYKNPRLCPIVNKDVKMHQTPFTWLTPLHIVARFEYYNIM